MRSGWQGTTDESRIILEEFERYVITTVLLAYCRVSGNWVFSLTPKMKGYSPDFHALRNFYQLDKSVREGALSERSISYPVKAARGDSVYPRERDHPG